VVELRRIVTLVSIGQASVGHKFRVYSVPDECRDCKLYSVCLGKLRIGVVYRIVELRPNMGQKCKITGDSVVPAVVEELPIIALVPINKALEGVVVTYEAECEGCEECDNLPLNKGEKIKILKVLGKTSCKGRAFAVVEAAIYG